MLNRVTVAGHTNALGIIVESAIESWLQYPIDTRVEANYQNKNHFISDSVGRFIIAFGPEISWSNGQYDRYSAIKLYFSGLAGFDEGIDLPDPRKN